MRVGAALVAALMATPMAVAACSGGGAGPERPPAPPPVVTGYFVGRSDLVGAAVDFSGFDRTSSAVRRALDPEGRPGRRRVEVGIVSLVGTGAAAAPTVRLAARLAAGGTRELVPAGRALAGVTGPSADAARRLLPRRLVPAPGGAATAYVVLVDVPLRDVAALEMRHGPGPATELRPAER